MSYSVNWITKVVSVPTADLTLVSGTRYSLSMPNFLAEIRRLEWEFTEGLWAPAILDHTNTRTDFAGANYAPFDDMLNGYTVQFTGIATRVDLLGSNNDLVDVLLPTGVSVVPSNSAGLQIYTEGAASIQLDLLIDIVTDILKLTGNKVTKLGDIITIYEDDENTVWRQYNLALGQRIQL